MALAIVMVGAIAALTLTFWAVYSGKIDEKQGFQIALAIAFALIVFLPVAARCTP